MIFEETFGKEGKKKILNAVLIFGITLAFAFALYQYLKYSQYGTYQIDEEKITDNSFFALDIDALEKRYDTVKINGWIAYQGESILTWKLSILIQNEDGSCYIVPMALQKRTDVTKAMNDGFDYDNSGFSVTINKRYIKSDHAHYYILYENNDRNMIVDIDEAIREEAQ